jgi:hypothetical protein
VIDLGAPVPLAFPVLDDAGNPANADTVTLTVTLPDGTADQPAVTNPPALPGQYRYSYVPAQPGRHVVRWVAASPAAAYTDMFDVAPANVPSIVSLADAKQFLGIDPDDTSENDELRAWLAGVTSVIEREKNEVIARRQITDTDWNEHPRSVRLWHVPVISLDSLASADGTRTWDVTADVRVNPETGLVRLVNGRQSLYGDITAVYTAGYQVIPYHLMQASLVLLQHVWETQRGPASVGGGVIGPEETADYKQAFMLPRKVREWLGEPRPSVI